MTLLADTAFSAERKKRAPAEKQLYVIDSVKRALVVILLFIFPSCSGHYGAENFDTKAIFSVSVNVLQKHEGTRGNIYQLDWPLLFEKIGVKSVIVRDDGLYILLSSFLVREKGLFIPRKGVKVNVGPQSDPSYKELRDGVYSYVIKG